MQALHRVLLVNSGTDDHVSSIANDGTFPALGVVSLATALQSNLPELEVIAVDGQVTSMPDVLQLIKDFSPDLLGVSALSTSYLNSIRLIEEGKNNGAVTVLGNDQAAAKAEQILIHQPAVDYLCSADVGEFALIALVRHLRGDLDIARVPQLWFRDRGNIRHKTARRSLIRPRPEAERSARTC